MKCPRCQNEDARFLYQIQGRTYCRKCIAFHRVYVDEPILKLNKENSHILVNYHLHYELSSKQKEISQALIQNYHHNQNSVVFAVTGAGKTEITYDVIRTALLEGKRVCFTIPRKALCEELYDRFSTHFHGIDIGLIYGGCEKYPNSPFVICTTHQLYRFVENPFDLMIIDEVDAFPFYQNEVLNAMFYASIQGCYIKMSATITTTLPNEDLLVMNRRYHGFDLPTPKVAIMPHICWFYFLVFLLKKWVFSHKIVIVYVPCIKDVELMVLKLSKYVRVKGLHSASLHISSTINLLKSHEIDVIVATTILERGVTLEDVQVVVYQASHSVFNERTLMQIAGRVGRKKDFHDGFVYFIDSSYSQAMKTCITNIKHLNQCA